MTGSQTETSKSKDPHYYEIIIMSQLFSFALFHYKFDPDPDIRCKPKCKYWQFKQMTEIKMFSFCFTLFERSCDATFLYLRCKQNGYRCLWIHILKMHKANTKEKKLKKKTSHFLPVQWFCIGFAHMRSFVVLVYGFYC